MSSLDTSICSVLVVINIVATLSCSALAASSYGSTLPTIARFFIWLTGFFAGGHSMIMTAQFLCYPDQSLTVISRWEVIFSSGFSAAVVAIALTVLYTYYRQEYRKQGHHGQFWRDMAIRTTTKEDRRAVNV